MNETFGKLVYDSEWIRSVTYELWGKTYHLDLIVETSNEEHEILKVQEQAYKAFLGNLSKVEECVKEYFLHNYYDLVDEFYVAAGTSWACSPAERKQLQNIIDSYERPGKDAINDMLLNIWLSSIIVEPSGRIYLNLYVNIPDSHGLLLVIDSEIRLLTPEEYEDGDY